MLLAAGSEFTVLAAVDGVPDVTLLLPALLGTTPVLPVALTLGALTGAEATEPGVLAALLALGADDAEPCGPLLAATGTAPSSDSAWH